MFILKRKLVNHYYGGNRTWVENLQEAKVFTHLTDIFKEDSSFDGERTMYLVKVEQELKETEEFHG